MEEAENLFRTSPEGEVKRNRPGKKVGQRQQQKLMLTKKGKEIVYSASPGRPLSLPQKKKKKDLGENEYTW